MSAIVAIDAGNTRIKWGVSDGAAWMAQGAIPTADVKCLAALSRDWPVDARIVACNVAGEAVETAVATLFANRAHSLHWLRASAEACGVRNTYEQPERLGADRWAALIGARNRGGTAGLECLVVCAGTATTVDWLDAQGVFRGGLILPGVDLMRSALAHNTAQLPMAEGTYCPEPRTTRDAIASGCLHAQAGAIERMFSALPSEQDRLCLITGGAAKFITPCLNIPFRLEENLILEGLVSYAASLESPGKVG